LLIFFVVTFSFIAPKKPFFSSGSISFFISSISSFFSFLSVSSCIFGISFFFTFSFIFFSFFSNFSFPCFISCFFWYSSVSSLILTSCSTASSSFISSFLNFSLNLEKIPFFSSGFSTTVSSPSSSILLEIFFMPFLIFLLRI
jgi:hypothetical protein